MKPKFVLDKCHVERNYIDIGLGGREPWGEFFILFSVFCICLFSLSLSLSFLFHFSWEAFFNDCDMKLIFMVCTVQYSTNKIEYVRGSQVSK